MKTRVSGKSAICVHQKVVPDSDSKRSWSNKVSSTGHDTVGGATFADEAVALAQTA